MPIGRRHPCLQSSPRSRSLFAGWVDTCGAPLPSPGTGGRESVPPIRNYTAVTVHRALWTMREYLQAYPVGLNLREGGEFVFMQAVVLARAFFEKSGLISAGSTWYRRRRASGHCACVSSRRTRATAKFAAHLFFQSLSTGSCCWFCRGPWPIAEPTAPSPSPLRCLGISVVVAYRAVGVGVGCVGVLRIRPSELSFPGASSRASNVVSLPLS